MDSSCRQLPVSSESISVFLRLALSLLRSDVCSASWPIVLSTLRLPALGLGGSCMAICAWVWWQARNDTTSTAAQLLFILHSLSPSVPEHVCSPLLAPSRFLSCQLIRGCRPHALRSCALEEAWFPRPLLATAKLPAVFYATTIVASGSRKRPRSLSSTLQKQE